MTTWDKIYKDYQKGGQAWATLSEGLIPQFLNFVDDSDFKNKSAFDIGFGTGKYLAFLKTKGFLISGIDSSETAVEMAKKELGKETDLKCANMFEYSIPANTYDFIYSISTIHHGTKSQVKTLLEKIHQSLMLDGKILITLPDYKSSKKWNTFKDHQNLGEETLAPLSGPEQGLAHSFYHEEEFKNIFKDYANLAIKLDEIGRWIITATK